MRVLRWRRRTRSRSSIRATALPIADDETPSCRPATVKLRASAARTKAFSDPRLSIREPPFWTLRSDMFGTMAQFSNLRESPSSVQGHIMKDWIHEQPRRLDHRWTYRYRACRRRGFRQEGCEGG